MHEIESQRAVLPPIPASAIKDQLHDDAWAQQYLQDGKTFQVSGNVVRSSLRALYSLDSPNRESGLKLQVFHRLGPQFALQLPGNHLISRCVLKEHNYDDIWNQISSQSQPQDLSYNIFTDAWKDLKSLEFDQFQNENQETAQHSGIELNDKKFVYSKVRGRFIVYGVKSPWF